MAGLPTDRPAFGLRRYLLEVEAALDSPGALAHHAAEQVAAVSREVRQIGSRHRRADLIAAGLAGEGRLLVRRGQVTDGLALLDAAAAQLPDGSGTELAGRVFCQLLAGAHELIDLARVRDWSGAADRWLADQGGAPAAVTGRCLIRLAQAHLSSGDWARAAEYAGRGGSQLTQTRPMGAGEASYLHGEVYRLRGELAAAEAAYRRAHQLGCDPQPGFALLRLAQRQLQTALAAIGGALVAETDRLARVRLCAAQVEIALAAGELDAARKASDELADTAASYPSRGLAVLARQCGGAVLVASGQPVEAVPLLHEATQHWQELLAPYEVARTRLLLAHAYRALADLDAAALEHDAATAALARLAAPTPASWQALPGGSGGAPPGVPGGAAPVAPVAPVALGPLTSRETQVLALVAAGRSNRQVATALSISEKTVARHLANIFAKLGVRSRTEAASYAYRHGLPPPAG